MKIQYTLIGLFAIILLVISPFGLASSDDKLVSEDENINNSLILKDEADLSNIDAVPNSFSTDTTTPISNAITNGQSDSPTTTVSSSTNTSVAQSTPSTTTATASSASGTATTTASPTNETTTATASLAPEPSTSPPVPSEITPTPTTLKTESPGRKFDGLSFMGGMILVIGLGALIFLVVRHLRRTNRLPYANLR